MAKCACPSSDAYRCWEIRYGPRDWDVGEIEMDGGPCECDCHEWDEDLSEALCPNPVRYDRGECCGGHCTAQGAAK